MRFVDVKNYVAFRKIFGNENKKVILISILNAVLGLEGQDRVKDVTLLNPYQLPRLVGEKSSIIDVKATDEKGATFIVEMQVAEPAGFDKRVLYYTSKDYAGQINSGDDYTLLRPVYFIGILNFNYFTGDDYLSSHSIIDEATGQNAFKDLKFRFIELKKFNKKEHELKSIVDKWTFFIKYAEDLDVMPANVDDEGLKEAYEAAAQHNWTKEAYDAYIYAGMREQDERGRIQKAEEIAEKRAQENTRNQLIVSFHENGVPIGTIASSVGISESEVRRILDTLL